MYADMTHRTTITKRSGGEKRDLYGCKVSKTYVKCNIMLSAILIQKRP